MISLAIVVCEMVAFGCIFVIVLTCVFVFLFVCVFVCVYVCDCVCVCIFLFMIVCVSFTSFFLYVLDLCVSVACCRECAGDVPSMTSTLTRIVGR